MSAPDCCAVLDFWFSAPGSVQYGQSRVEWFKKSDAFDALIRERFLPLYDQARAGTLSKWHDSPLSLMALIIACNHFSRARERRRVSLKCPRRIAIEIAWKLVAHDDQRH